MSYNANSDLQSFHTDRVFVDNSELTKARNRRKSNQTRLERGLTKSSDPLPLRYVPQGSYAMHTMVQSEIETSDIDDGVVFCRDAIKGPQGGDKTSRGAREMVQRALAEDNSFKTPPEVRKNCVRVHFDDGFHLDMPVYREYTDDDQTIKEFASGDEWKKSDPEDITNWLNQQVRDKSPDSITGRQMRRVIRLVKYWARSRASWTLPSGFVLSVLVDEAYRTGGWPKRDDTALLRCMEYMYDRLLDTSVYRPVSPREEITNEHTRKHCESMRANLVQAIKRLGELETVECDELQALQALKAVFDTNYWDTRIEKLRAEAAESSSGQASATASTGIAVTASSIADVSLPNSSTAPTTAPVAPRLPIDKRGGGQFA